MGLGRIRLKLRDFFKRGREQVQRVWFFSKLWKSAI